MKIRKIKTHTGPLAPNRYDEFKGEEETTTNKQTNKQTNKTLGYIQSDLPPRPSFRSVNSARMNSVLFRSLSNLKIIKRNIIFYL